MIRELSLALVLMTLGACSSELDTKESTKNQSNDTASQEQLSADRSGVEAYEQNDTTLSGEQNNKEFVNKLDDKALVSALRDGGHVIYKEYATRVSPLMSAKPESGKNTFLVGHDDPFQGVTMPVVPAEGIYPAPMGVAYIAKPLGDGKFDLVAKIKPNQWQSLAQL